MQIFYITSIIYMYYICYNSPENIALNKPANQTGTWQDLTADKAVDGLKDSNTNGIADYYKQVCAHPDTGDSNVPAEWWVYLGDTYSINTVTVYNTYDNGGEHMKLAVSIILLFISSYVHLQAKTNHKKT